MYKKKRWSEFCLHTRSQPPHGLFSFFSMLRDLCNKYVRHVCRLAGSVASTNEAYARSLICAVYSTRVVIPKHTREGGGGQLVCQDVLCH